MMLSMLDDLVIQPEDSTPIFQQLENQIIRFIRAGRIKPGQELPSVRAIAAHLAVNPMTVSKTINRLVDYGWLQRRRGRPTCVADHLPDEKQEPMDQSTLAEIQLVVRHCQQLRLSLEEVLDLVAKVWKKEI